MKESYAGMTVKEFLSKVDTKIQVVTGKFGQDLLFLTDITGNIEDVNDKVIELVTDEYMEDGWLEVKVR